MLRLTLLRRLLPTMFLLLPVLASADSLDDIVERGTIRIGVSEFAPWAMRDGDGELIGYEIDLGRKLAKDMGIDADFHAYAWEEIIPALESGEIDVIAAGMSMTPERALRIAFSLPTGENGIGIATNTAMTRDIRSLAELNNADIRIATVGGTLAENVAEMMFRDAEISTYGTADLAEKEVVEGRAHVYAATVTEIRFLSLRHSDSVDVPIDEALLASSEAFAMQRGAQGLLNFINAWITVHRTDKWLDTTRDYWFGSLDWMSLMEK